MSGKDGKLSPEDRILWGRVAKSTRPMAGKREDLEQLEAFLRQIEEPPSEDRAGPTVLGGSAFPGEQPVQPPRPAPGHHHPLEKPVKRKLAKGRLELEARIDLHGLVQSEAHAMLLSFLVRAHERGLRHVLVITGKGSSLGSEGALKRAVPLWFSKPDYRHLISSYETAARHHGGEGALYVRLARSRGAQP